MGNSKRGYLSDYKIAFPQSSVRDFLSATEGSDYSTETMRSAIKKAKIVGDVVQNYNHFAPNKQAIIFAPDMVTAREVEEKFKSSGIKAKFLSSLSNDIERFKSMNDFRSRQLKVLINIDLFDEGLDVPGIECVIHLRPTKSLNKYKQMNGRGLRPGKILIIIDHVGNVVEHGLPDRVIHWSLNRVIKKKKKINIVKTCLNPECLSPVAIEEKTCKYCGFEFKPTVPGGATLRDRIQSIGGDLVLLTRKDLEELVKLSTLKDPKTVGNQTLFKTNKVEASISAAKKQRARLDCQKKLADIIAKWAGILKGEGFTNSEIHREYFSYFGETINESLSKPRVEMENIIKKVGDL